MKFAKVVFWVAAIWGVLTIAPLYFMYGTISRADPPPITHPGFFYGFAGTALAWQLAFFVIAKDPARYRTLMLPSIFEKFSYAIAVTVLVMQGRMHLHDFAFGCADLLLGFLFIIAYYMTPIRGGL